MALAVFAPPPPVFAQVTWTRSGPQAIHQIILGQYFLPRPFTRLPLDG
ncbi:MAG: hypothetical protein WKF30_02465 [Pyrinomonadaceae bacterium]